MKSLIAITAALAMAATSLVASPEGKFERKLSTSGPVSLDVVTDAGGISIRPGTAGTVEIRGFLKASGNSRYSASEIEAHIRELEQHPPIEQHGNDVRIGYVSDKSLLRGVSLRFEILTPADSRVRAQADSGGIHVEGVQGPADCKADSGGINITSIASEVRAAADSGGIHVRNIKGPVFARADSGGIEALEVSGAVDIATDSGGVQISQTAPAPVRIRADSGGARVRLAPTGYDLSLRSDSGRITAPEMTVQGTVSRQHIEGKLRGGGPLVDVKVDSGNVTVE